MVEPSRSNRMGQGADATGFALRRCKSSRYDEVMILDRETSVTSAQDHSNPTRAPRFDGQRFLLIAGLSLCLGVALSGCVASSRLGGGLISPAPEAEPPVASGPIAGTDLPPPGEAAPAVAAPAAPPPQSGTPKIVLLLPLSASGATGAAAQALKNAADLAMADLSSPSIELVVKDERGTPDGAREAAKQALAEGASVIIGPLLASSVQATASVMRPASRPVIAFSTDIGVAGRGVYLLSFLPQSDVDRILSYAAAKGKKSIAALIPDTAYGNAVNATLQSSAARNGLTLKTIERYTPGAMDAAALRVGALKDQIDALFIAENGDGAAAAAKALTSAGIDTKKIQLLGTSAWDDPRVFTTSAFTNGWFAQPDKAGFDRFAEKYRTAYGAEPVRIATLAYDAVFLANALKKNRGDQAYDAASLTAPEGAVGIDGLFRLRSDGTNERGLVVMQVTKGGASKIDAAPASFP